VRAMVCQSGRRYTKSWSGLFSDYPKDL